MSTNYTKNNSSLFSQKKMWNTRELRMFKKSAKKYSLQMLTCYDFQTAELLNQSHVDLILVGDSLGNVILGFDNTISVTLEHMKIFSAAVKRGADNKFVIADLPFGTYSTLTDGIKNATELFAHSNVQALKLEGAFPHQLEIIKRLTESGIPIMGHIGLTPQSVHQQGGYFTHGKTSESKIALMKEALLLQEAGVFSIVLECVTQDIATMITEKLTIPTIGIGSGKQTDGQVLVINDLLKMGVNQPPSFCNPIANLFDQKLNLIQNYLMQNSIVQDENISIN